jgi:catechol 2,3-dioxygenase-like lactoylglutathione lyase family enzyme
VITGLSHTTIWVLDQDEARDFYTQKLGFEVNTDATMDDFRWLTVSAPPNGRTTSSPWSFRARR